MDRKILEKIIVSSGMDQETVQEILADADNYNIYNQLNNNAQIKECLKEINSSQNAADYNLAIRKIIGITRSTIKYKKKQDTAIKQQRHQIVEYIKQEMLPQANIVIRTSNTTPNAEQEFDWLCSLKAFSIEYMLKSIETLADAVDSNNPGNKNIEGLVQAFIREAKDRLANKNSGQRYNGHEIEAIFNNLIPPHIKTLIKYKAITNSIDPNVRDYGKIITPINGNESMENFVADYFLTIKDCDLTKDSNNQNEGLDRNNKAFVDYRYRDKHAKLSDYESLNCMMVSTYMTLTFLLEHPDLVRTYDSENIISYSAIEGELSEEEYNHLKELGKTNGYDTNSLITYHMFLKYYLKERTPKLDDERYSRINNLFETIKDTNDISKTSEIFIDWFKKVDINSLSKAELKELKVIAPEFIYNSLSYEDKLIFKKCQEKGIEFEYYYKINPRHFENLINNYSSLFKGQSIDVGLLVKSPQEVSKLIQTFQDFNLDISTLPSYYFDYSAEDIKIGYEKKQLTSEEKRSSFLKEDELNEARKENRERALFYITGKTTPNRINSLSRLKTTTPEILLAEQFLEEELEKYKQHMIEQIMSVLNGEINISNYTEKGLTKTEFESRVLLASAIKTYKTDRVTSFLKMDESQLRKKMPLIKILEITKLRRFNYQKKYSSNLCPLKLYYSSSAKIRNMMDKGIEVRPKMLFLHPKQIAESYNVVKDEIPDLEIGDYLLYKTPKETQEIMDLCDDQEIAFRPEFLYFDMELCRSNLFAIDCALIGVDTTSDVMIGFDKAQEINEKLSKKFLKNSQTKSNSETHLTQSQKELSEMLGENNTNPSTQYFNKAI